MEEGGEAVSAVVKSAPQPPVSLRKAAIERLLAKGIEPSPENLLLDSEDKDAPLHEFFYNTPDELWIKYGRYEAARRILRLEKTELVHGGKIVEMRRVEAVRIGTIERWGTVEQIVASPELRDAYLKQVEESLHQAAAKLSRVRELMQQ